MRCASARAAARRSVEQLRGIEGARVKRSYQLLAQKFGVKWSGRAYNPEDWDVSDLPNRCLSSATAALYGASRKLRCWLPATHRRWVSFTPASPVVCLMADIYKFDTVVPAAFQVAAPSRQPGAAVRLACRDIFRKNELERIIPDIEEMLAAGEIPRPEAPEDAVGPAIPNPESLGDAGHHCENAPPRLRGRLAVAAGGARRVYWALIRAGP